MKTKDTVGKITLRDFIAIPFLIVGTICDYIAVTVGSKWTAQLLIDEHFAKHKVLYEKD